MKSNIKFIAAALVAAAVLLGCSNEAGAQYWTPQPIFSAAAAGGTFSYTNSGAYMTSAPVTVSGDNLSFGFDLRCNAAPGTNNFAMAVDKSVDGITWQASTAHGLTLYGSGTDQVVLVTNFTSFGYPYIRCRFSTAATNDATGAFTNCTVKVSSK